MTTQFETLDALLDAMEYAWLCTDCLLWHENRDISGVENPEEFLASLNDTGGKFYVSDIFDEFGELVPGSHEEFSDIPCDSCNSRLAGERFRAVLFP